MIFTHNTIQTHIDTPTYAHTSLFSTQSFFFWEYNTIQKHTHTPNIHTRNHKTNMSHRYNRHTDCRDCRDERRCCRCRPPVPPPAPQPPAASAHRPFIAYGSGNGDFTLTTVPVTGNPGAIAYLGFGASAIESVPPTTLDPDVSESTGYAFSIATGKYGTATAAFTFVLGAPGPLASGLVLHFRVYRNTAPGSVALFPQPILDLSTPVPPALPQPSAITMSANGRGLSNNGIPSGGTYAIVATFELTGPSGSDTSFSLVGAGGASLELIPS